MKAPLYLLFWILLIVPGSINAQHLLADATHITNKLPVNQDEPYKSRLFQVQGIPDLTVFTPSGDIEVVYNPDIEGVKVDLYVKQSFSFWSGSPSLDKYRIIFRQNGNSITASVERKQATSGMFGSDDVKFRFVIQTPRKIATNLRSMHGEILLDGAEGSQFLQSDAGNIKLINSEGEISLISSAGNVFLEKNRGYIQVKSIAGDVQIEQNHGEARIRTVSGDILANKVSGSFICATTSGEINVSFDHIRQGVYMETISGNVYMELNEQQGFDIEAGTHRLDVKQLSRSYITGRSSSSGTNNLKLGDGGIPVSISTISGTVQIKPKGN